MGRRCPRRGGCCVTAGKVGTRHGPDPTAGVAGRTGSPASANCGHLREAPGLQGHEMLVDAQDSPHSSFASPDFYACQADKGLRAPRTMTGALLSKASNDLQFSHWALKCVVTQPLCKALLSFWSLGPCKVHHESTAIMKRESKSKNKHKNSCKTSALTL